MTSTHIRKIVGDLRRYKARTSLVSVAIFVGVLGTVALFSMGDIIVRQLERDLKPEEMAMLNVELTTVTPNNLDNTAYLATLQALPNVTSVQAFADYEVDFGRSENGDTTAILLRGYSAPLDGLDLEPLRLLEGDFPAADEDGVVIAKYFADAEDLAVGDTLWLSTKNGTRRWSITGIVLATYHQPEPGRRIAVFTNADVASAITGREDFTGIQARFSSYELAKADTDDFVAALVQQTHYIPVGHRLSDPDQNAMLEEARTNSRVMGILAAIALVVSGFLVANVISSLIAEQRNQVGTMKAMGASWFDISGMYAGVVLSYGLIGIVPGVLLGSGVGYYVAQQLSTTLGTYIDTFTVSLTAILYGVVLGLLIPLLAAIVPILRGLRTTILDAMTDAGIESSYGKGPVAHGIAALPLPPTLRQSLNNINRKRMRLAFTTLTMTVAVAAFMGIFAVLDSVLGLIQSALGTIQADIVIMLDDPADYDRMALLVDDNIDGIKAIQQGSQLAIEIEGYDPSSSIGPEGVFVSTFDTRATTPAYELTLKDGSLWTADTPEDGIIITQRMAEALNVGVGDSITIRVAGRQGPFPIIGVSTYPFDGIFMDWRVLAQFVGFVVNDRPVSNAAMLIMEDGDLTADELDETIAELKDLMAANDIGASYMNFQARTEIILSRVSAIRTIFSIVVMFIAAVSGLGLLTTLTISVFERQREIGIMRSIGTNSLTIVLQFLTEGITVGVLAWLIGIPLSYGLSSLLSVSLNFGDAFRLVYPLEAVLYGFIGMITITALASVYPALTAANKSVSNILRYQ